MKYMNLEELNKRYFDLRLRILEAIYDKYGTEAGRLDIDDLTAKTGRSKSAVRSALSSLKANDLITVSGNVIRLRRGIIRESVKKTS